MYSKEQIHRLYKHNNNIHCIAMLRNPVDRAYSAYWYARRVGAEKIEQFEQAIQVGIERFDKSDTWRRTTCDYLERSTYPKYISWLQETFYPENIYIFTIDDMKRDVAQMCNKLFQSTRVFGTFTPDTSQRHNQAAMPRSFALATLINTRHPVREKLTSLLPPRLKDNLRKLTNKGLMVEFTPPAMKAETRIKLVEYFHPHNTLLSKMLGRDLEYWNQV